MEKISSLRGGWERFIMKAIIIEDEIVAAQALESLIKEVQPDMEILVVLQSIDESVEWFQLHPMPDLVFMDIHLADGSSFGIFNEVDISCPIIFTTAYDEYALKAFEVNSIDYLLKPISKQDLERAINKYKKMTPSPAENIELIQKLLNNLKQTSSNYKNYFLVPDRDRLIPVSVNDIAFICIDSKMVKAVGFKQKNYYLDQTLDEIMHQLSPEHFFRANRQYIVARSAIKDLSVWFGGKLSINLIIPTPERIVVSKARVGECKKWIAE